MGKVEWIGIRAHKGGEVTSCTEVLAVEDCGLEGDHAALRKGHRRQVTLIDAATLEALREVASVEPAPHLTRRNLVISGLDLHRLIGSEFRIGEALLYATADCPPCRRMDELLGEGVMRAMEGLGGICTQVRASGRIRVGDEVSLSRGGVLL